MGQPPLFNGAGVGDMGLGGAGKTGCEFTCEDHPSRMRCSQKPLPVTFRDSSPSSQTLAAAQPDAHRSSPDLVGPPRREHPHPHQHLGSCRPHRKSRKRLLPCAGRAPGCSVKTVGSWTVPPSLQWGLRHQHFQQEPYTIWMQVASARL